jgi:hypothetical protein
VLRRCRTSRAVFYAVPLGVLALWLVYFCFTPYAVCRFGVDLRPPWQNEAEWHLSRIDWFVQEAGYEHIVRWHRADLVALGVNAVPELIEQAASVHNRHYRERAVFLLKEIGEEAYPLVVAAATHAEGDRRGRLLYATFVAFDDRIAFEQWLQYAVQRGAFALQDNFAGYHIQRTWNSAMPDDAVLTGDEYTINPEFVEWWRANGAAMPFAIRAG